LQRLFLGVAQALNFRDAELKRRKPRGRVAGPKNRGRGHPAEAPARSKAPPPLARRFRPRPKPPD
jgi:hypothetical protein